MTFPHQQEYADLWRTMVIKPQFLKAIDAVVAKLRQPQRWREYQKLYEATNVPPQVTAVINERECGGDLRGVLHNGELIVGTNRKTKLVPAGRGPFATFFAAGIDAYRKEGLDTFDWEAGGPARVAYALEKFNGFGYRNHGINSPYLWASTNHYSHGKYVSDGKFDPTAIDQQLGGMAVLRRMMDLDQSLTFAPFSKTIRDVLADTAGPKPVVIKGPDMTKDQILKLQKDLNTLGATPPLVVDGISGGQTRNAVVSFQKLAGLVADGIAGPRTLAAIDARLAGGTPPTPIVVSREIHVVAQHGLFGGWPIGLSMGIDAVIAKGQKEGLRITSTILEHYQDSAALAAAIAAYKRKAIVVLTGHSLGAGDAVESSNAMVRAGTPPTLLFVFDPTWNSTAPPVEGPVRAIDIYGTAASPLGHDKLEAAPGFTGKIINVGRQVDHVVVDDDLVGHSLFLGELRFLAGRTDKLPVYPVN